MKTLLWLAVVAAAIGIGYALARKDEQEITRLLFSDNQLYRSIGISE